MKKIIILLAALVTASCNNADLEYLRNYGSPVFPDYRDVTVPCNIAPLNFSYVDEPSTKIETTFEYKNGKKIHFRGAKVEWRISQWRKMTEEAKGSEVKVYNNRGERWKIHISDKPIDYGLQYRLVSPGYQVFGSMSIRERSLTDFKEKILITGDEINGCVNCHEYNRADPSRFTIHFRGGNAATMLKCDDICAAYETKTDSTLGKCVYPYWHPSGKFIAYSTNRTHQQFHIEGEKLIEVYDDESDILIYNVLDNTIKSPPALSVEGILDNYPVFSADGRSLYFCRYHLTNDKDDLKQRKYSLCKMSFNEETGNVEGEVQTVIDAKKEGISVAFPRPSYNGRFIMYTSLDYGLFPIWHKESDLWLHDLSTGQNVRLANANSPDAESFHNFSSDSKWFVFCSRRDDGRFTHAYIAQIDENGNTTKPFLLPQKEPVKYYSRQFYSYNTPCFVTAPVKFGRIQNRKMILSSKREKFQFTQSLNKRHSD